MSGFSERFELRLDGKTLGAVDDWRASGGRVLSRSEAIRQLLGSALERKQETQLFQLARAHVLFAASADERGRHIPDAYLFAWNVSVYPLLDDFTQFHEPFSRLFDVSPELLNELIHYLGDRWDADEPPTFYELERRYDVRGRGSEWDRMKLIYACRYFFLHSRFGEKFWNGVLRTMEHPAEAKGITDAFDRAREAGI